MMFNIFKRLFRLSASYAVGDVLSRGASLLLIPLYTYFMRPDEYGLFALAMMISVLLTMLLTFGSSGTVNHFYYQFPDEGQRRSFLGAFWLFLIVVPGIALGALFLFGETAFELGFPGFPYHPYAGLVLSTVYLNCAFGVMLIALYRAREAAGPYMALAAVTLALTLVSTAWFVVIQRQGVLGALRAQLATALPLAAISAVILWRETTVRWHTPSIRAALKFGVPLIPHFISHWLLNWSDRALLGHFVGLGQVGVYSLAYQFGSGYQTLTTSASHALSPMFSRAATSDSEFRDLGRVATYYLLSIAVLGVSMALLAGDLIRLIAPPAYHPAGLLVPWIALGVAALGVYYLPINTLVMTAGQTKWLPVMTAVAGLVNVGLNVVFIPRLGALAAAIDTAVGYAVLAGLVLWAAQRARPLAYESGRIGRIAVAVLAAYALGRTVMRFDPWINLLLGLGSVASLPAWLLALGFWTEAERRRIAQFIRRVVGSHA